MVEPGGGDGAVVAVVDTGDGAGLLHELDLSGTPVASPVAVADVAAAIGEREHRAPPRWLLANVAVEYPGLLARGARLGRCHDLTLVEALLLGQEGRWGQPRAPAAAWARRHGQPVPDDPPPASRQRQPALFDPAPGGMPAGVAPLTALVEIYADQRRRIAALARPGPFRLLAAAESAAALAAVEMARVGVPWRVQAHQRLLTELLGERPAGDARPPELARLAARIEEAFGHPVNPDSPADLVRAFARAGLSVPTTRSRALREVAHPAVPALLAYKELARIHAAHGWNWLDTWVREGRFHPEYVVGGVVSGRWASRGGGALQIPKVVRRAVVAEPGWLLVVADAGQLEPRILAALSGDPAMMAAAGEGDLYQALADQAFDGQRDRAKLALLSAMYGGSTGVAGELLAVLRRRFAVAMRYVEAAARAGEEGRVVRSHLGRVCPPPDAGWWREQAAAGADEAGAEAERLAVRHGRQRGRFTRNFVIQGTAAEWAQILLVVLRRELAGTAAELVFFQHDEVMVHAPAAEVDAVTGAVLAAAEQARLLLFGPTPVRFPVHVAAVRNYAEAK